MRGLIIRSQSGFYWVKAGPDTVICRLRGRLKQGPRLGDVVAVGDWVYFSRQADGSGMIEAVEERQRMLSRMAPTPRGEYQQIFIANPDQAVFVFACADPEPRFGLLDRFLVIAEKQEIPSFIVANKVDLVGQAEAEAQFALYEPLGYPVIYTSALQEIGLEALRACLADKLTVLLGPSGVGKSSLLNVLQPGLGLSVREVSQVTGKGRHTTVVRQMFPLDSGGYIADTPGLKALALWDMEPEELDGYFPELRALVDQCQFNDCTHLVEPGCAVQQAVRDGLVHPRRYQSYARIRSGEEE